MTSDRADDLAAQPRRDRDAAAARRVHRARTKKIAGFAVLAALVVAMALSTKFVSRASQTAQGPAAFDPATYGAKQFPIQQQYITAHAVPAATLATALKANPSAASKYGVSSDQGATYVVPVTFTGRVGKVPPAGYTPVTVAGLPKGTQVGIQLGPAVIGTDLRDATGKIQLGQFENQIQYQNAATGINNQLKALLTKVNATGLQGKTVKVAGVFQPINPQLWNVTPATITVVP